MLLERPTDKSYMEQALELAMQADQAGEVPIGALIVSHNEVVARGWNCPLGTCDPTAHAEIVAIRAAATAIGNYRLLGTTLYVTIEPCVMCIGAMLHARVSRLVYGAPEPKFGAIESVFSLADKNQHMHKMDIVGGVLSERCGQVMQDFFARRRRC